MKKYISLKLLLSNEDVTSRVVEFESKCFEENVLIKTSPAKVYKPYIGLIVN